MPCCTAVHVREHSAHAVAPESARGALDKGRAARRLLEALRALVPSAVFESVRAGVSAHCSAEEDAEQQVKCVMKRINAIDGCLGRRCVRRVTAATDAERASTLRCECANATPSAASAPPSLKRSAPAEAAPPAKRSRARQSSATGADSGRAASSEDNEDEDASQRSALMRAADAAAVRAALAAGDALEAADAVTGRTPLHWAVVGARPAAVEALLALGADVEARAKDGATPLLAAARAGRAGLARLLLARGADREAKDLLGFTPLMFAASYGHAELLALLAHRGAQLDARDPRGCTPLMLAARAGRHEAALALAEVGCRVDAACDRGCSALHYAARNGHATTLRALLGSATAGAACRRVLDAPCTDSNSPLLLAAEAGRTACVSVLLQHGARPHARNRFGLNAVQLASLEGHEGTVRALLAAASRTQRK